MRHFSFIAILSYLVVLWMLVLTPPIYAQQAGAGSNPVPIGRWVTPSHDAVIQIMSCGPDFCGEIVGIQLEPNKPIPKDWAGETQCHLTIIRTAPSIDRSGHIAWTGTIIDPRDGSPYHAQITLDPSHHLQLRGYVGLPVFGRTQTWIPYTGPMTANCRLPAAEG